MKFVLNRASRVLDKGREVEINTLEELIELVKKEKRDIIVEYSKDCKKLMVYDDYLE